MLGKLSWTILQSCLSIHCFFGDILEEELLMEKRG